VSITLLTEDAWWALLAKEPEDESLWGAFSWWLRDEADDPAGAAWVEWYRRPGEYLAQGNRGPEVPVRHRAPRGPDPEGGYWLYLPVEGSGYNPENAVLTAVAACILDEEGTPWEPGEPRTWPTREAAGRAHLAGWRAAWAAGWRPAP
jgi:hypothetical protein